MSPIIPYPLNLQPQSRLVQLPQEIKDLVFTLCFAADGAVVEPAASTLPHGLDGPSKDHPRRMGVTSEPSKDHPRRMRVNLLHTCRRLYHETDRRPLFTQNTFRFSTANCMSTYLRSLSPIHRACIRAVEISAQSLHASRRELAREWTQYLSWSNNPPNKSLGSLHADAPGLKCVRLDFEAWPRIPMKRVELWNQLRDMLAGIKDLERVVVVGASKGAGMAKRAPFSPVHYVGGDDVGADDLVPRMWSAVGAADDAKIVRWTRVGGRLELEVVSVAYLLRSVDPSWCGPSLRKTHTDPWPESGSCTLFGYENRDSDVTEPTAKGLNPSVDSAVE